MVPDCGVSTIDYHKGNIPDLQRLCPSRERGRVTVLLVATVCLVGCMLCMKVVEMYVSA